jgi:hypothetical protein
MLEFSSNGIYEFPICFHGQELKAVLSRPAKSPGAGLRAVDLSQLGCNAVTLSSVFSADVLSWVGGSLVGTCKAVEDALGSSCVSISREQFVARGRPADPATARA